MAIEFKYYMGFSEIGIIGFNIFINLTSVAVQSILDLYAGVFKISEFLNNYCKNSKLRSARETILNSNCARKSKYLEYWMRLELD